jgi:hypothetical protein
MWMTMVFLARLRRGAGSSKLPAVSVPPREAMRFLTSASESVAVVMRISRKI